MKRLFNWWNAGVWHDTLDDELDDEQPIIEYQRPVIKRDLIDTNEHPVALASNFDPQTIDGWNFMVRTLSRQRWLKCQ